MKSSQAIEQKRGLIVIIVLAVLTAIEFGLSVGLPNPNLLLAVIALVKAGLIVHYFMHITQLRRKEA
jgi:caa(3)-type oxidase subunit IV